MTMFLKVLDKDMTSPYQSFKFSKRKWYHCADFDTNPKHDCAPGFYATEIEGLPYAYRPGRRVFEARTRGKNVNFDIYKRRWEDMMLVRELDTAKIKALAIAHEPVCGYRLSEALFPINQLLLPKRTPTDEDIALLRQWVSVMVSVENSVRDSVVKSVRDSVVDSVWASVWASVRDSVRASVVNSVWDSVMASVWTSVVDSVYAYIGTLFPNISKWQYVDHEPGVYPFQSGSDLWRRGLVPSYDGKTWRLHSGKKAKIVWDGKL